MNSPSRRHFVRALASTADAGGLGLAAFIPSRLAAQAGAAPLTMLGWFDGRAFGARGDGTTKDTAAIQAAIDACTRDGGGVVLMPTASSAAARCS